ncbi:MAG: ATP-dependent DNA helicase RecG [Bdellovibrionaceae bacterium]|nr:ATP-dependent DNA helicase RecG [Pseudobdellovibrionaceae bacterium]
MNSTRPKPPFNKNKTPLLELKTPVQYVKGVGPTLGEALAKHGVKTVRDLIEVFPRTYEDRRSGIKIRDLKLDQLVSMKAQLIKVQSIPLGRTHRRIYDITLQDSSGVIHCKFFRVPYKGYFERFKPFQDIRVVGKVIDYRGRLEFHHPDLRDIDPEEELQDEVIPVYVEMEGISSFKWQKLIRFALSLLMKNPENLKFDTLPVSVREKAGLIGYFDAIQAIHYPAKDKYTEYVESRSPSHQRLIFEEFFLLEAFLYSKKLRLQKENSPIYQSDGKLKAHVIASLPFQLTRGQLNAVVDIENDFLSGHPMHRLIQGDVGCGKTLVAFLAAVMMKENSYQSCIMVPTEILADQHYKNAINYLSGHGISIALLTGKTKLSERRELFENLAAGQVDLLIGTHAVLEDDVVFKNLSLVVIDEQHRFGVNQRAKLKAKGPSPHFLVMTATPIPRTLSMTVFGDLDVTVIKELPPGRMPIQTRAIFQNKQGPALDFLKQQIQKGRQGYIVFPLVEESEKIDLKNATEEFDRLKQMFPDLRWALLHGKMKPVEKEEIMVAFKDKKFDVLVSTTVIEVGVDVPNANIMMIEHAERFGLSQLHQLRGRVGRGEHKSFCILIMGYAVNEESRERVSFMEKSTDGFEIAEFDLKIRGPGEFLGTKQSGLVSFKIADLIKDQDILFEARKYAADVVNKDPGLEKSENIFIKQHLLEKKNADIG